jgi:hypothetical protein
VAVGFVSSQGGEATTGQIAEWCRPEIVYVGGKPTAIQIVTHARALRSIGAKRDPSGRGGNGCGDWATARPGSDAVAIEGELTPSGAALDRRSGGAAGRTWVWKLEEPDAEG